MLVFAASFLLFIFLVLWIIFLARKNHDFFKNIPGPKPLPLFGNVFEISSTTDILAALMKFRQQFGGVYKIQLGPIRKVVIVSDYKFLEAVLSSTKILNKPDEYYYLRPWLGTGLLTSDGPKWKKHRRILTPAFHFQILEQFIDVFEDGGNRLVRKLRNKVGTPSVDVYPFVTLCTLDIICESAMGTSINAQLDDNSDYVKSVKSMARIVVERMFSILQMSDFTFPLTKNYYVQKKSLNILHKQTNDVIAKRQDDLQIKVVNDNSDNNYEVFGKRKKAFLDLMLGATGDGKPLTLEEIRQEVDTFMFEGHDTTASAISFSLYCLATNPDIQEKAYQEQQQLFGDNQNPQISYSVLQKMKYLELVIKETLRLYPSVPFFGRKTNERVEFENFVLPKDLTINIFAFGIHRDPTYFKDPEKFDPSRFETMDGRLPYAYIPFSAGPRNCIGQKFAMLEMKSTLSKILRNFVLKPATPFYEPVLAAESVLKSKNGVKISLEVRNSL